MTTSAGPTHVVGIGASAGGLEAMEAFFDNVPTQTGMAYVVVQHLSPDFKSMMDDLLARHTSMSIHLVEDGMLVEADHLYLIPAKKEMIIAEGRLLLSERDMQQELTLPIDVFFRSLAQDVGARAIAIVLSGSGSDGSRGIRDVHDAGGLVIVQNPESAQFDGMPRSSIDTGVAHCILTPHEMPAALVEHAARSEKSRPSIARESHGMGAVYQMLLDDYGLDFTQYKPSTVTRRIERRISLAQSPNIEQYVQQLRRERNELDVLYRDLLIGVTRFFRDQEAFNVLEQTVLPELLQRNTAETPLRIWVAGCATGEEAYSIAIVLLDLMKKYGERPVKIFATDIHTGSLERASRGIYDDDAVKNVSPSRLERYFIRVGSSHQVVPDVRQMVVFATHNVIKDAPFTRVDLVTCRNLLIYLQLPAQQKVLSLFHFALNRGGILMLGPSETAGALAHDFESVDKHWRVYRKHSDVRTPVDTRLQPFMHQDVRSNIPALQVPRYSMAQLLGTYDVLLDEVMPPSLLVSDRGELIHAFGGASKFLRLRDGRQRLEVLDVVDDELKMVLVGGLKRAIHEPNAIVFKGVRITTDGQEQTFDVTIRSIRKRSQAPHLLVSFEEIDKERIVPKAKTVIDLDQVSRHQLASLEAQLSHTKESLQSAIEELESSNEELQASNEELQASNEELQSTNEELQSVNEELYTVNAEYQRKIAELTELTNDMDNLLSSTEVGTIFLDRDLCIRKFTPQIASAFSLVAHDVGRAIETFAHKLDHPELVRDLKTVLKTGVPIECELATVRGKSFFLRTLPYRAKGEIAGVVMTLIDVSGLKATEDALFHERYLLNSLLGSVPDAIYFKDAGGRFIRVNDAMAARFGLDDPHAATGKLASEVPNHELAEALHVEDEHVLRTGEAQRYKLEKRLLPNSVVAWELVSRLVLRDTKGALVGIAVVCRDVSEQKRAEERSEQAVKRRDEFLAMLSHELRNPLGAIVSATGLLRTTAKNHEQMLDILQRQSQQMARLLDDLLEASRVTQDKIELRRSVVELDGILGEAMSVVRDTFDARKVALETNLNGHGVKLFADPARLQQVLVNVLSNAAKYTPPGGHVTLGTRRQNGSVIVSVRDDGLGIPKEMLDSIFDLFVQCPSTLDRASGGLGVGLTLVRSLVAMHGGTVVARSDGQGRGSEFVVELPLATARDGAAVAPAAAMSKFAIPVGAKIVIVEDNQDSRELLCQLLTAAGFICRATDNGVSALALIQDFRPHVAILDVGLPEMDGFEVARRIRGDATHANVHLVALTGYGRASDRELATNVGFDAHLVKPVDPKTLLTMLGCEKAMA